MAVSKQLPLSSKPIKRFHSQVKQTQAIKYLEQESKSLRFVKLYFSSYSTYKHIDYTTPQAQIAQNGITR